MAEKYVPRHYTLDRLSPASLWLINDKLKRFLKDYDIKEYPLDCFQLVEQINAAGLISIEIEFAAGLSSGFHGVSTYYPEIKTYWIVLPGTGKPSFRYSKNRRINFSLAHELAHIFLGHLDNPRKYKTKELQEQEDLEADEFAGRLLMPEKLLLKSNFTSEEEVSKEYLVSDQALWKRFNNLKRLDIYGTTPRAACGRCGNREVSPVAEYCVICGNELTGTGRKGVRVVEYPAPMANSDLRIAVCLICTNEEMSDYAEYCRICGIALYNRCKGEYSGCTNINVPQARFCEICGEGTVYSERGVFRDWKVERSEYIKDMTHK